MIISDQQSPTPPKSHGKVRVVVDSSPMPTVPTPQGPVALFSKTRSLNLGIEASNGNVLSFIDADAIVGSHWLTGAEWLASSEGDDVTRLCYRVRYMPETVAQLPDELRGNIRCNNYANEKLIKRCFRVYHTWPRGHEGYADPEINSTGCWDPKLTFGNSQFSIRRDVLGDVRCDEDYIGAGFEDLAWIREIWRRAGKSYKGVIRTEGDTALLHTANYREVHWHNSWVNQQNRKRYENS